MIRFFFRSLLFTSVGQKDVAKISQVPGAPRNDHLARAKLWIVTVTIFCIIFQKQFTSISPVFTRLAMENVLRPNY